jgi:D-glycero-alpha-D-manno-heptose-7-phosphate kinase
MIITQTPVRISFLGGGTDYPDYYRRHGGATLATAINQYTIITVHRLTQFVEHRVRVHYSQIEAVQRIDDIRHPSARECLRLLGIEGGVEIHYVSNLPARTGLGSSSSATVGLLLALHAFKGERVSREQIAAEAIRVEQEMIRERVGSQDQFICALGGFRHLQFHTDGRISADPITLHGDRLKALEARLLLLYTGIQRNAHEVLEEQIERTQSGHNTHDLAELMALVQHGVEVLASGGDLSDFGRLLHEGWQIKRRLSSKVSTSWIDRIYQRALDAGALGGKLLGAGGGGFLLLYVEPDNRARVRQALAELPEAVFAFESTGSRVIFYRP